MMTRAKSLLIAALLFVPAARADTPVGFDFLGIKSPRWDCGAMLAALSTLPRPVPCGAFVDDTFGKSDACLRRLLASGRCSSFRGHLAWTNHKPLPAAALIPRAQYLDALQREYPGVKFYLSHICEHPLSPSASAALFAALRPATSSVGQYLDSAMSGQAATGALLECHGPTLSCPAVSLDGQSAPDVDVEAFKRRGQLYSLLWDRSFNCRYSDNDKRPPQSRTDCADQDRFNLLVRMSYPMPPKPPGLPFISPPEIWKPVSENHGGCKGKDCKPVAILNKKVPALRVLAMNGRQLATMPYYGSFGRGQSRYYLNMTAFQLGQAAEAAAQSEFVMLNAPGYRVVVNAYRRGGIMR